MVFRFRFHCSPWSQAPVFRDYRIRESCLTPRLSLSALGVQKRMCVWEKSLFCVSAMTVPLHVPSSQSHRARGVSGHSGGHPLAPLTLWAVLSCKLPAPSHRGHCL